MDNPQVTQTELAWLAGIWDGEGHISIRRTVLSKNKKPQYSPRLGVTNCNVQVLSQVRNILDRLGVSHSFREKGVGGFEESHRQVWVVSVETLTHSLRLLGAIYPYLVGKKFQAECIIEFCQRRLTLFSRKDPISKRVYTPRDFELVVTVLEANGNRRGTSQTVRQDAQRAMIQSAPLGNLGE